jgi:uncharacterized protein YigA (DUF484 family)
LSEETITFNLELNVEQAIDNTRRLETLLFRTLGLVRRLTGSESLDDAIYKIQRMVMIVRMAHTAVIAFQAASGPIGWALAAVGIVSATVSAGEFLAELK